ncbi:hypothetical protein B0H10DRAFT_2059163 [Mycena sp. CBHHK59/15]|nr:hypothetical protein B0H10DRAFT_2059163 [Mycena sp. CBHHK59/15]
MSCQIHCPVHCGLLPERVGPLESPYLELLLSNYVVPLDSQIPAIQNTIQAAEDRISGIDDEIMRLQTMISRLKRQRSEVLDIADIHRGAVSTMRRFPSEILTEIFSHCVQEDALSPFNPSNRHPWLITRVCSRWRAAALSSPTLWCHLVVVPLHDTIKESSLVPLLSLQLERAGQAPLSVHLRSRRSYTSNVLDVLLTASERWENIILDLTPSDFHHLHTFVGHLPVMKKLEIRNAPQDCPDNIFMSLPALEDLGLCNIIPPARFNLPWTQLRKCTMDNCWSLDVLRILSLASSATQFVISNGWRLGDELATSNTNCSARSLTFDDCDNTFVEYVLAPLIAPALDELIIELPDARDDEDLFQPSITQEIMSFLTRYVHRNPPNNTQSCSSRTRPQWISPL